MVCEESLTVIGFGSRILANSLMAPKESQGGHVKSAAEICMSNECSHPMQCDAEALCDGDNAHFIVQDHEIRILERQVPC